MNRLEPRHVAGWLLAVANNSGTKAVRSAVWPPYEDEDGFFLVADDGSEWEILVRRREKS